MQQSGGSRRLQSRRQSRRYTQSGPVTALFCTTKFETVGCKLNLSLTATSLIWCGRPGLNEAAMRLGLTIRNMQLLPTGSRPVAKPASREVNIFLIVGRRDDASGHRENLKTYSEVQSDLDPGTGNFQLRLVPVRPQQFMSLSQMSSADPAC